MPQLADLIRAKYPGVYDDMDDAELEKAVIAKYPQYKDLSTEKPSLIRQGIDKLFTPPDFVKKAYAGAKKTYESGYSGPTNEMNTKLAELGYPIEPQPGYMGDVMESMSTPGDIALMAGTGGEGLIPKITRGIAKTASGALALRGAGKLANAQTVEEGAAGALETGMGALGFKYPVTWHGRIAPAEAEQKLLGPGKFHVTPEGSAYGGELPVRQSREIPYRMGEPSNIDLTSRAGTAIGTRPPIQPRIPTYSAEQEWADFIRSTSQAEHEATVPLRGTPADIPSNAAAQELERARTSVNALPPIRNQAMFKYMQPDELGGAEPYFDVLGKQSELNPSGGSTISQPELTKRNIDVIEGPLPARGAVRPPQPARNPNRVVNPFAKAEETKATSSDFIPEADQTAGGIYTGKPKPGMDEFLKTVKGDTETETLNRMFDMPQEARTKGGKLAIGADVQSLGKVLGTSLYKGDIAPIATKELLQNSVDAIRHLGDKGLIDVVLNPKEQYIEVADNGKGLTRKELETVFTDLGASGKRNDESAVGGFGLAKAAPLLGGERVEVITVAKDPKTGKLIENSFSGTPDELLKGVDIAQKEAPAGTPTGTKVRVYVPKDSNFYSAKRFAHDLSENSQDIKGNIRLRDLTYGESATQELPKSTGKPLVSMDNSSATTNIIIPDKARRTQRSSIDIQLANNGMYQGTKTHYFGSQVPNIPNSIIVDIKPKVPEGHPDYPFTANREELRGTVEEQVKDYIDKHLVAPAVGDRLAQLKKIYEGMPEININGKKVALYDPKGQLTPEDLQAITSNPGFKKLVNDITSTVDDAMLVMNDQKWIDRLEKTGIIFEDKLHGIHLPNPSTGKSTILVNPFPSLATMPPDEASANILHTILHEIAHVEPTNPGHNEDFTVRLGDIYAKFGAKRSVEAQNQIINSVTDSSGDYSPEIQELLQRYTESRRNPSTTEDLLSGTGVKSKTGKPGEGEIPPGSRPNGKGINPTTGAVDKLFSALNEAKGLRSEQETINRVERARRFAEFAGVRDTGQAGAAKSLRKLRGEFEKVEGSGIGLNQKDTDTLFTTVKKSNITSGEKAQAYTALFKLINGGNVPSRSELAVLNDVFGPGFGDKIIEMHGGLGGKINLNLGKTVNTMKSLMSSIDVSGPMRQGIGMIHRPEWRDAFKEMFKYLGDKDYYDAAMEALQKRQYYLLGRESGLFLAKPDSMLHGEEAFMNSYVHNLPGIRNAVGASERAYTGFLNKLRADVFDNLVKQAKTLGHEAYTVASHTGADGTVKQMIVPSKTTENIARYINTATGRGRLGFAEKFAPELNYALWSPRLISSRLTSLNPLYYASLDPFTRQEAIKSLLAIAAAGTTIATLAALSGGKISANPLSADFGKARFGTKVVDPWSGFQQPVVAAARFLTGRTDAGPQSRGATLGNFTVNKLAPATGLAYDLLTAKAFTGKDATGDASPYNIPQKGGYIDRYNNNKYISTEVGKRFVPIFLQDLDSIIRNDPSFAELVGLSGAAAAGVGVQDYPERTPTRFSKLRRPGM